MPRKTILIVEDDPLTVTMLERHLAPHFAIAVAGHGREALEWLAAKPSPAVVLLDIQMPVLDGMALLDVLRKQGGYAGPFVVLAAAPPVTLYEHSRVSAVLNKPFAMADLLEVILWEAEKATLR